MTRDAYLALLGCALLFGAVGLEALDGTPRTDPRHLAILGVALVGCVLIIRSYLRRGG